MARTLVRLSRVVVVDDGPQHFIQLQEAEGDEPRRLTLMIGFHEAGEISRRLREEETIRPLTHTLIDRLLLALDAQLEEIEIHDLHDGTYFATLRVRQGADVHEIDGRPSDGIALALSAGAAIYVADKVWDALESDPGPL